MRMKKLLAALLAAMLLLGTAALADAADNFDFFFDDEGYTGEWTTIDALNAEFCLPDGWVEIAPEDDVIYSAVQSDGKGTLEIRVEAEDVDDLEDWAEARLKNYVVDQAGLYQAVVVEPDENQISVGVLLSEGKVVHFHFTRATEEDVPREFALQIAGSVSENWLEDAFGEQDDVEDEDFFAELGDVFADFEG